MLFRLGGNFQDISCKNSLSGSDLPPGRIIVLDLCLCGRTVSKQIHDLLLAFLDPRTVLCDLALRLDEETFCFLITG